MDPAEGGGVGVVGVRYNMELGDVHGEARSCSVIQDKVSHVRCDCLHLLQVILEHYSYYT